MSGDLQKETNERDDIIDIYSPRMLQGSGGAVGWLLSVGSKKL